MNFRAAVCPSCGGRMQLADDLNTIKCNYCGVDVIVREAIKLAGRVKEFTVATPVEKVTHQTLFDVESANHQTNTILFIFGVIGLGASLCVGAASGSAGVIMGATFLVFLFVIAMVRRNNLEKIRAADREMLKKPPTVDVISYQGECPYCSTAITLSARSLGENCPACQKRIVIRNSKFFSVDTPVGGFIQS